MRLRFRRTYLIGAGLVLLAGGLWGAARLMGEGWRTPAAGLWLPELKAEVFFLDVPEIVRAGPPRVVVVRLAGPAQFVPHTFRSAGFAGPQPIEAWAQALGAPVVFNAGQFDDKLQHLGWLKAHGAWLSRTRKPAWMGLLVSGPLGEATQAVGQGPGVQLPWAQVVDLAHSDAAVAERYAHVLQSMMLVDDVARPRVRQSDTAACRTVVAEDAHGRLLLLASEGAVTLHELARWLPRSGLQVVRAMNLDGGVESQLAIVTPQLQLMLYGQYGKGGRLRLPQAAPTRALLPAVVAVVGG